MPPASSCGWRSLLGITRRQAAELLSAMEGCVQFPCVPASVHARLVGQITRLTSQAT